MQDETIHATPSRPPSVGRRPPITGKRLVLLAVAVLLTAAAVLAIGILLVGDFGSTEGRVLATTALLAAYGVLTVPAVVLHERRRAPALTVAVVALAVAAAAITTVSIWIDASDEAGKAAGTLNGWLVAVVQSTALTLRRRKRDPRVVRLLFAASSALVVLLAVMLTIVLWAEIDSEWYGRALGALLVLDVLLVALQPILARAYARATVHRFRVAVPPDRSIELTVEAPDLASAAASAIRTVERDGHHVLGLEVVGERGERDSPASRSMDRRSSAPRSGKIEVRCAR